MSLLGSFLRKDAYYFAEVAFGATFTAQSLLDVVERGDNQERALLA